MTILTEEISSKAEKIFKKYGVKRAGIFGSYARGEQKQDSDIDLLVSFERPINMVQLQLLKDELKETLDSEVDIVSEKYILPQFKGYILNDLINIYGEK